MNRREFLAAAGAVGVAPVVRAGTGLEQSPAAQGDRAYWVGVMTRLADPVLKNLANGTLKARMPVEQAAKADRRAVSHLEALGRLVAGIAPWIELAADETTEGRQRAEYADLTRRAIARAVDPSSPDFLNFTRERQPLVDAAFLAQGILRAPRALRESLGATTTKQLVAALESSRAITPVFSNWLLFSATVEAALARLGATWDRMRVDYALRQHDQWYKGDGVYGDGPAFHWDYYNSFVIQPMLLDVLDVCPRRDARMEGARRPRRTAGAAICGYPRAAGGARRHVPRGRPFDRVPFWRLSIARADGAAQGASRGSVAGPGPWRPDSDHPAIDRGPRNLRRQRLAPDWLLRASTWRR